MLYDCEILENTPLQSGYMRIRFRAPELVRNARAGQFAHVRIPGLADRILRRPFSLCSLDRTVGVLTILYKIVGTGTEHLSRCLPGTVCSVMGPLGNGFPAVEKNTTPILVAGGFGAAATLPVAQENPGRGILLLGARSRADVLLTEEYQAAGYDVRVATQDGSMGKKGLVTDLLADAVKDSSGVPVLYACGPGPMLMALGKIAVREKIRTYLSLDEHMCCGVGACFACVVKVKDPSSPDGWRYSRSCKEGPVYPAEEVYYE